MAVALAHVALVVVWFWRGSISLDRCQRAARVGVCDPSLAPRKGKVAMLGFFLEWWAAMSFYVGLTLAVLPLAGVKALADKVRRGF